MKAQAKNNGSAPEGERSLGTEKVAKCPHWTLLPCAEGITRVCYDAHVHFSLTPNSR